MLVFDWLPFLPASVRHLEFSLQFSTDFSADDYNTDRYDLLALFPWTDIVSNVFHMRRQTLRSVSFVVSSVVEEYRGVQVERAVTVKRLAVDGPGLLFLGRHPTCAELGCVEES